MKKMFFAISLAAIIGFSGHLLAYPDEAIERFAVSAMEINDLHQNQQQAMHQASPQEQEQIRQQMMDEAAGIIQDQGLSVDQYNEMSNRIQQDPEMMEQVQEVILDITQR